MKSKTMRHLFCRSAFAACLVGGTLAMTSCEDENLTGQPSWLGNSIYERLQEMGNYTTTLKLIDDLKQTEVLSHTGSRTLFAADDAAFEEWFKTNEWGARNYDQLTDAQKKMLLNGSMVKNAYLVELLSNVSGNPPQSGMCMRRESALTVFDSVYKMKPSEMPENPVWDRHRGKTDGLILMRDATSAPLIHFLPKFMQYYDFTSLDLAKLTGNESASLSEAWVNGKQIVERDITCKNGYIHKVSGVIEPCDNMAGIIRKQGTNPADGNLKTSEWSKFLDRFAAPFYDKGMSDEYNRMEEQKGNKGSNDSVFVLRYYSERSSKYNGSINNVDPDGEVVPVLLSFDPGWNQYMYQNTMGYDMHYDAAMMFVPTDAALREWFSDEGDGSALYREFKHLDSIPNLTLVELLDVNMIQSLTDKIPSKFSDILDPSTQESLGVEPGDIKKTFMGCNGVVFVVDKVFTPKSYSSVIFPAMIREKLFRTIYWAIDYEPSLSDSEPTLYFKPYLNSMQSRYSLFLPTNDAMRTYLDPANFGARRQQRLRFAYDVEQRKVTAKRVACTVNSNTGEITATGEGLEISDNATKNRLRDMIDNMIIVGDLTPNQQYYKTKSGSYLRILNPGQPDMTVEGAWQIQHNRPLKVTENFSAANGYSYVINDSMPPMTSTKSFYMTLKERSEYKTFYEFVMGADENDPNSQLFDNMLSAAADENDIVAVCANSANNYNFTLFGNYNYTVYVPKKESINKLVADGILPTWDDFEKHQKVRDNISSSSEEKERATVYCDLIKERINDFVRIHVQDNSVIIGGEPVTNAEYTTMKLNPENRRFYTLTVSVDNENINLVDPTGQSYSVVKTQGAYNNICRDYWFENVKTSEGSFDATKARLLMDSDATVHLIDGVLRYDDELGSWEKEAEKRWNESQQQNGGTKK